MQANRLLDTKRVELRRLRPEVLKLSSLQLISARNIQEMDLPPINWIVKELLPEGLAILAGRPKLGKSWMALNIALAVANGNNALGFFETVKYKVLYIALEDNYLRIQSRMNNILSCEMDKRAPENLFFIKQGETLPKLSDGGLEELKKLIQDDPEIKLIVIDTLGRIKGDKKRHDNNIYQADYDLSSGLQNLAIQNHVCILLVHHTKKGSEENVFDEISGTTGLTGGVDTMLVIKKAGEKATLHITGRDVMWNEYAINFDESTYTWNVAGKAEEIKTTAERQEILNTLEAHRREMKSGEIAKIIGKSNANTSKMLGKLAKDGLVESPKYGIYKLTKYTEMMRKIEEPKKTDDQQKLDEEIF